MDRISFPMPDWEVEETIRFTTLVTEMETPGKEQRRSKGEDGRLSWKATLKRHRDDGDAVWEFFKQHRGRFGTFIFPWRGVDYVARFNLDVMSRKHFFMVAQTIGIEIIQVFEVVE